MDFEHLQALAGELEKAWGGQTLASLLEDASRELNGTCTNALCGKSGERRVLIVCVTGEAELNKMPELGPVGRTSFDDWSTVSLFEAATSAIMAGGFAYAFGEVRSARDPAPLVLIAADPRSVDMLERLFGLSPA